MATEVSKNVIESAPGRALAFLLGISGSPYARNALMSRGYTQEEHNHAWSLLAALSRLPRITGASGDFDRATQTAVAELNAWDEPNFACIQSILERKFAEQAAFVFENVAPSDDPPEAVLGITTLLDRLDALESGKDRKASRAADKQALERLAARGYTPGERARLRALVTTAQTVVVVEPLSTEEANAIKTELWGFIHEWGTQAKAVIKRRDVLIRLGLAKRKKPASKNEPATPAPSIPDLPSPAPPSV